MTFTRIAQYCFRVGLPLYAVARRVCLTFSAAGNLVLMRAIIARIVRRGLLRSLFIAIVTGNLIRVARIFRSVTTLRVRVFRINATTVEARFFRGTVEVGRIRVHATV